MNKDVDISILAVPEKHCAEVYPNSADAMVVTKAYCHTVTDAEIKEDKINDFLNDLRSRKISFSFRLKK